MMRKRRTRRLMIGLAIAAIIIAALGVGTYFAWQTATGRIIIRRVLPARPYSGPRIEVVRIACPFDKDGDGANDLDDILSGARAVTAAPTIRAAIRRMTKASAPMSSGEP